MNLQQLFENGMKRPQPDLLDFPAGIVANLGCGNSRIEGAINVDWPEWDAERYEIQLPRGVVMPDHPFCKVNNTAPDGGLFRNQLIRCPDDFLTGIHAYHFLEHLNDPRRMLREMQRCLKIGGVVNIVVPHYSGSMAHHDLDHKHTFALDTWANTFNTPYYDKDRSGWQLKVHFNMLMAIVERNAAIVTQLVKEPGEIDVRSIRKESKAY
jgi:SAM-dependent methyltransferase